jgi:hypothetical protein
MTAEEWNTGSNRLAFYLKCAKELVEIEDNEE